MNRYLSLALFVSALSLQAFAQDTDSFFSKFQVHGNLTQGFLFTSGNNYLTTDSENGSFKWTEGVLNITVPISDRFHIAAEADSFRLGQLDGQKVVLDFAYADFKVNDYLGIRAGRVKTPIELFNDTQDIDALYPWAMLPESVYPSDLRSFHLKHDGVVLYGGVKVPKKLGSIAYQAFVGNRSQNLSEGFAYGMNESGTAIGTTSGLTDGVDVRWTLPVPGWFVGASYMKDYLKSPNAETMGVSTPGEFRYTTEDFYTRFEHQKLTLSAEMNIEPSYERLGTPAFIYSPSRIWYVMGTYQITSKVSAGSYFSEDYSFDGDRNRQEPGNYSKDTALNTRIDINRFFYVKLEGHYIAGTADGLYNIYNPNGLQKDTRLALAKVGFVF